MNCKNCGKAIKRCNICRKTIKRCVNYLPFLKCKSYIHIAELTHFCNITDSKNNDIAERNKRKIVLNTNGEKEII